MNNENTEAETNHTNERLNKFLKEEIEPESLAKYLRRVNYVLAINSLAETDNGIDVKWVNDGYYWINQLAEVLDPNINID